MWTRRWPAHARTHARSGFRTKCSVFSDQTKDGRRCRNSRDPACGSRVLARSPLDSRSKHFLAPRACLCYARAHFRGLHAFVTAAPTFRTGSAARDSPPRVVFRVPKLAPRRVEPDRRDRPASIYRSLFDFSSGKKAPGGVGVRVVMLGASLGHRSFLSTGIGTGPPTDTQPTFPSVHWATVGAGAFP